jgi:O-antigen biosynthesis alpha-1,3-rhamnosyltransferase
VISVALDLRDPQRSGLARVASSMARAFVREFSEEFSVNLAGPAAVLREMGASDWGRCRIVDWGSSRYSLADLRWQRVNKQVAPSIWFYPHWDVPLNAIRHPYVMFMHDLAHLKLPEHSALKRTVARHWIGLSLSRSARILAGSHYSAGEIAEVWPDVASKTSVAYHGVDAGFFETVSPVPTEIARQIGGVRYMLSVGIRKERKNLRVGVEVLRAIPELKWVVMGDWYPEWQKVAAAATQAGVADRMIVLDRQDDETLRALYQGAAFLFFPSRYEGFGLPIIEALASGTPVLAATTTSTGEIIGEAGWKCEPDDVPAFIDAAREILSLDGRRAAVVAERGRARAREFTWEKSAAGLAEAFRMVLRSQ